MAKELAIVLSNGSINSAVVTALANQRHRPIMLHAVRNIAADTSEETSSRARVAFEQQSAHFKPYREYVLEMPFLSQLKGAGGSKQAVSGPIVPPQNPLAVLATELLPIMATAARFAAHFQAVAIYVGLRIGPGVDELAQATEYVQLWSELLQLPCGLPELEFQAPLLELEPWQVVDLGLQVSAPFDRTWSCSEDGGEPCWACRGCRAREAAFQQAAKPDPLRAVRK